jgi:AcrR family transcriptional regulator
VSASTRTGAAPAAIGRPLDPEISRAILDATIDVLAETGFAGLSLEAVAQRAGVHRPAIYRRWPAKVDLVAAAISAVGTVFPDPDTGSVRDDLVLLVGHVGSRIEGSERARLGLRLVADLAVDPEIAALVNARTVRPWRSLGRTIVGRGIERGELRADTDPELVNDVMLGSIYARSLDGRQQMSRVAIERLVDTLLDGLHAPPDEPGPPPSSRRR